MKAAGWKCFELYYVLRFSQMLQNDMRNTMKAKTKHTKHKQEVNTAAVKT